MATPVAFSKQILPLEISSRTGPELQWADPASLAKRSLLLDIVRIGDQLITVGERGHVLLSEGSENHWTQILVPTRSLLTAVTVVGRDQCWTVGHDAVILHSIDAGKNWTRQFFAPDLEAPLFDVWFQNTEHGLAIGAYNLALETNDAGKNWTRRSIGTGDAHLYAITQGHDDTLYVAGEFGTLFRSIDYGKNWMPLTSPYEGTFFGILAPSNGSLLVFGLRGSLYFSNDSGLSWQKVNTRTTASLLNGLELTDGTIVVVGLNGTVLVSKDGGRSFMPTKTIQQAGIAAVAELTPGTFVTVGEAGITHTHTPSEDTLKK